MDAIVIEAREVTVAGIAMDGASVRLDLLSDDATRVTVSANGAALPDPVGKLTGISLICDAVVIAEPRFACDTGRLRGRGGPTGSFDLSIAAAYDIEREAATFRGSGLAVAGTQLSFEGALDARGWRAAGRTGTTTVAELRKFAKPWFELPKDLTIEGKVALEGGAADSGKGTVADLAATLSDVQFTNEVGDLVGEKLAATARLRVKPGEKRTELEAEIAANAGQAFLSIAFFDLAKNPLALRARGALVGDVLDIDSLEMTQRDLADVSAKGRLDLAPETPAFTGDIRIARLQFPAAYTTYLANMLASTLLGDLAMQGTLSGEVAIADNAPTSVHVVPRGLELRDNKGRLHLSKLDGDVSWSPAGRGAARISKLSWSEGGAYGLSGGAAEIEFVAYGMNFALARPTKLPILDGAIAIEHFAMGNLGEKNMEVSFKGEVEPISMQQLAKAFGWPEFSGKLAASIPAVTLRDDVLRFDGNVESQVFGGRITGSNIRLQDPLGRFPQFFADVRARDLDLGQVTNTFEVGSITGKLEADVLGLELFAWSPVAFDARLATPKGDKSRHRISAKAVSSLSNVGGGGGGVVQALQSGVLKFFDEYAYDKLGIRCQLRDDVCVMSGIEPAPSGYYIVKGSGLPRIDIVGNAGRVRWSQLLASIPTDFESATVE